MGRSISPDPRAHRMTLRFTAAELLATKEAAATAGLTPSDWVRNRAMDRKAAAKVAAAGSAAGRKRSAGQGGQRRAPQLLLDPAIYHELRHQGVNLNQIAHRLNKQDMPCPPEIHQILGAIRKLITPSAAPTTPKGAKPPEKRDGDGA